MSFRPPRRIASESVFSMILDAETIRRGEQHDGCLS